MKTGYKTTKSTKKNEASVKGYAMPMEMKPRISIDSSTLPAVKDWKVGKEYEITVKAKMVGLHEQYDSDKLCGDFEVLEATNG